MKPYFDSDGWYWADETSELQGPYDTEAEAQYAYWGHVLDLGEDN